MAIRKRYRGKVKSVGEKRKVYILSVGYEFEGDMFSLTSKAIEKAVSPYQLTKDVIITAAYGGYRYSGIHLLWAQTLPYIFPSSQIYPVNSGECSGLSAAFQAYSLVASGLFDVAISFALMKIHIKDPFDVMKIGLEFAAEQALRYMRAYKVGEEVFEIIVKKNAKRERGKKIIHPIREGDFSLPTDGAAVVVFASEKWLKERGIKRDIFVLGGGEITYPLEKLERPDGLKILANKVYKMCDIKPEKIDVVESYDQFPHQEIMWYEGLGFADFGEGWKLAKKKITFPDGDLPHNLRGSVMVYNSPNVSSLMKLIRLYEEMAEGKFKIGLAHSTDMETQHHTIMILKKEDKKEERR